MAAGNLFADVLASSESGGSPVLFENLLKFKDQDVLPGYGSAFEDTSTLFGSVPVTQGWNQDAFVSTDLQSAPDFSFVFKAAPQEFGASFNPLNTTFDTSRLGGEQYEDVAGLLPSINDIRQQAQRLIDQAKGVFVSKPPKKPPTSGGSRGSTAQQRRDAYRNERNTINRVIQDTWSKADRQLGGWLPGGGVASPVTRALFPPQPFPGRSKELEKITGVKARIIDQEKTPTLVSSNEVPKWSGLAYANPLLGEIGIPGYRGGRPEERYVEMHELGHINTRDKGWYSPLGGIGRGFEALSDATGNLPPIDIAAGFLMREADAREEDRADRFAAQHLKQSDIQGQQYGINAPVISPRGTSEYGDRLRETGQELIDRGIAGITNPFGLTSGFRNGLTQLRAAPLRAEMNALEPRLKELFNRDGDNISPELLEVSKRHSSIRDQLRSLGVSPD